MKKLLLFILLFISGHAIAGHIAGGEMFYKYLGKGGIEGTSKYRITLRLFRECNPIVSPGGQGLAELPSYVYIGIYKNTTPTEELGSLKYVPIKGKVAILNLTTYNPCLVERIPICYQLATYEFDQELTDIPEGYTIGYQTCCRSYSIVNVDFPPLSPTLRAEGATYSCQIPGTNVLGKGVNSSPVFYLKDTTLVCANDRFTLDMSASDPDIVDSLSYALCAAYNRGRTTYGADTSFLPPPYEVLNYVSPFSGTSPLGVDATIDSKTGIISGIAPDAGAYVINVCVNEWRNGVVIGVHRKDFTLKVASCTLSAAKLRPSYSNCNSFLFQFGNEDSTTYIDKYIWNFGDYLSLDNIDSTSSKPFHRYSDTGEYRFSLTVFSKGNNGTCVDSARSILKVFPGFNAIFGVKGNCIKNPFYFIDSSISKYGKINSWHWDMGETTATNDVFSVKDTSYIYPKTGLKTVKLIVGNTKGCFADTSIVVNVLENPSIKPLRDTLICVSDTLPLFAKEVNPIGKATFTWTPNKFISDTTSPNPVVYPSDTIKYHLLLSDEGCDASDSITVNTKVSITVKALPVDTLICEKDSIHLFADTYGLYFKWTSDNPNEKVDEVKSPLVSPSVNFNKTRYSVKAIIGNGNNCFATDATLVYVRPYPIINAGLDDAVCFGDTKTLNGAVSPTAFFNWSPINTLVDSTTLSPTASPDTTTKYYLTAYYTGKDVCPKPIKDSVIVTVIPQINISAGNDTTVVVNEPLHLAAIGSVDSTTATFLWRTTNTQQDFLDKNYIYNPTALVNDLGIDSITYVVTATLNNVKKCSANDTVRVLVYQTLPQIFVPNVFMPNGPDGAYRTEKPTPVGVLRLDFFRVFDRYGKMLFSTSKVGEGWDGNYKGEAQPSGTYIYEAKGVDYRGIKTLYNKGTFVLIR